jgi:hypothetical protein
MARGPGRLAEDYRTAWLWNQRGLQRATEIVDALARAGIRSIALKGLALIVTCYRDAGARPMGDVDLLVPAELAVPAAEVLRGAGWTARHALTPAFLEVKHAAPFVGEQGEELDVHWRVFEEACAPEADEAWWAASRAVDVRGTRFGVLAPADQLLHVCVHGAKWTWRPAIHWIADAVSIVRAGDVDWARLVAQARARRFTLRARETLEFLAASMQAPIPREVLMELAGVSPSALERFEYRVHSGAHPRLGELPRYWCNYLRSRPGGVLRPLGFARYLQRAWELPSLADVPARALALAARRLRAPRSPGRAAGAPESSGSD